MKLCESNPQFYPFHSRRVGTEKKLDFYVSLTINRCHLESLCELWGDENGNDDFPFHHAIVSPLFARNGILSALRRQRRRCRVILDSGGFHVQQGRIELRSASRLLRRAYALHSWADRFALPDSPLTSMDSRETANRKLSSTRRQYRIFPAAFPNAFRRKLLPVVHGTTREQICRNALAARRVGSQTLGFGGFSTSGPNSGVNSCTQYSLRLLAQFTAVCADWKMGAHVFGIGGPSAVVVLHFARVKSFDSAGWIRTAAYGNVYLPYVGALNVTGAAASRRFVTLREFNKLREATGHMCPFCRDSALLVRSWRHRALHNYCTIDQLVYSLKKTHAVHALRRLYTFNRRFASYLELILREQSTSEQNPASQEIAVGL